MIVIRLFFLNKNRILAGEPAIEVDVCAAF